MTVLRGFGIVLMSAVLCSLVGTGVGYLLGVYVPGYYQAVFRAPSGQPLQPAQIGLGLGLTQGLVAGVVVGCVVVLAVAWYNSRRQVVIQDWGRPLSASGRAQSSGTEAIRPESDIGR